MVCGVCQHDNPEGNRFCGECGHDLAPSAEPVPRYTDRLKLVRREAAVVAVGIVLLLAAACGFWYILVARNGPQATVSRFIEADRAGRYDDQRLLVVDRWDARLVLALLQSYRQKVGTSLLQQARIVRADTRGDSATVDVQVYLSIPPQVGRLLNPAVTARPPSTVVTFYLVHANGAWRIDPTQTLGAMGAALVATGLQGVVPPGITLPGIAGGWPGGAVRAPGGMPPPVTGAPAPTSGR